MKKYPKVPRYDHPVVDSDVFSHPNTILLEKFDGANCRFMLYLPEYHDSYSDEIKKLNPEEDDLIIFSKNKVQGLETTTDKHVRGTYGELIDYLIENVDKKALKEIYDKYGLVLFYGEYMREHSISEYDSNIPLYIGFDVYNVFENNISPPENKYREKFTDFFAYTEVKKLFSSINLEFANEVGYEWPFDTDSFEVPTSNYGDVKSEGVIIRNDTMEVRYKYRSDFFKEIQKKSSGVPIKEIEDEQDILDTFCPEIRIRKMINKMVVNEGVEFSKSMNEQLYPRVLEDMWSEEYHEIMRIDANINPSKLSPMMARKCIKVIEKMDEDNSFN